MPELTLYGGTKVTVPDAGEVADLIDKRERARTRGIKWMRLPSIQGIPAASAIQLGDNVAAPLGPEQGFAWSLRRIVIDGMTSGTTPDVINMYRNAITGQPPLWQFNGNNFGYSFGPLEMVLLGGDALKFGSVGTFAATGLIRITGELVEVPAERLGLLVVG